MNSTYEDGHTELALEVEADKAAEAGSTPVVPVDWAFIGTAYQPAQAHLHTGARWVAGLVSQLQRHPQRRRLREEIGCEVTTHAFDRREQEAGARQRRVVSVFHLDARIVMAEKAAPVRVRVRLQGHLPEVEGPQDLLAQQLAEGQVTARRQRT